MTSKKTTFLPVAGGKGGTGKSFLVANLSIALAEQGKEVVMIDLDLGGSNLHSYLGIPNKYPGIGDFLKAKTVSFKELQIPTGIENVTIIPGDGQTPFMANIGYMQKMKLMREIKKTEADFVLLDLGAGSGYNTLDFFALNKRGIVISTPDFPAIMNMMVFLKNFMLRLIERSSRRNQLVKNFLKEEMSKPISDEQLSIEHIFEEIKKINSELGLAVEKKCKLFHPLMIYNMVDGPDDMDSIVKIDQNLRKRLSLQVNNIGFLPVHKDASLSVRNRKIFYADMEASQLRKFIKLIARRIIQVGDAQIENSVDLIMQDAQKYYSR